MEFPYDTFYDFCYAKDYQRSLDYLESIILPERWNYTNPHTRRNQKNPILENYIFHTFKRLVFEYRHCDNPDDTNCIIYIDSNNACFNTGLYTTTYEPVFAFLNIKKYEDDTKPWFFYGFVAESMPALAQLPLLPNRANYFLDPSDLIYNPDYPLRFNTKHILEENIDRFPTELQSQSSLLNTFEGAINIARKKVRANYRLAVPTFFDGRMCMLLPLDLMGRGTADLALAIEKTAGKYYLARTCLTLDMAYNDARLIAKPDDEWLRP